jgi:hypothetical protein
VDQRFDGPIRARPLVANPEEQGVLVVPWPKNPGLELRCAPVKRYEALSNAVQIPQPHATVEVPKPPCQPKEVVIVLHLKNANTTNRPLRGEGYDLRYSGLLPIELSHTE